jgi:hypothetical protein
LWIQVSAELAGAQLLFLGLAANMPAKRAQTETQVEISNTFWPSFLGRVKNRETPAIARWEKK